MQHEWLLNINQSRAEELLKTRWAEGIIYAINILKRYDGMLSSTYSIQQEIVM